MCSSETALSEFQRRRAFQLFNVAVTQEAIEEMADDVYVFERPSPTLQRLEKLAGIFHGPANKTPKDLFEKLRLEALKFRDAEFFRMMGQEQFAEGSIERKAYYAKLDRVINADTPAFRVVS